MASAPVVANLNDLVNQFTSAEQPESDQLDTEIAQNDQSGTAQEAGLDSAEKTAFGDITQQANDRGGYFSGFAPNAQASYVGSTYLPALAKLQTTIAATKNTLLGQKADLATTANTSALDEQKTEQAALDTYNQDQADQAATEQRQQEAEAATAAEDAKQIAATQANDSASASVLAAKTYQDNLNTAAGQVAAELNKVTGVHGYVSPQSYAEAKKAFESQGYSGAQYDQLLAGYRNPSNKYYALG